MSTHTEPTQTFTERVRDLFLAHPHQWLDGLALAQIAGQYAWRSRVSDARRTYGLRIENRVRTVREADGRVWKKSEYRYVPTASTWTERAEASPDGVSARVEGRLF